MKKGIIYLMNTAVSGLIKIGKTETKNFKERMRQLEANGYYNVVGLKKFFAIELEDYEEKEDLLHEIFNKHQVENSELFAIDVELLKQLLLSFSGKVIWPENINSEKEFIETSKIRKQGKLFNFYDKGLKNGDEIVFEKNKTIKAKVVGENKVEYNGEIFQLTPLLKKLFESRGELNPSTAYQGAYYFMFKGTRLKDLPDRLIE